MRVLGVTPFQAFGACLVRRLWNPFQGKGKLLLPFQINIAYLRGDLRPIPALVLDQLVHRKTLTHVIFGYILPLI